MKRDQELVRQILLTVESLPENEYVSQNDFSAFSSELFAYHVFMLMEEGLLKAVTTIGIDGKRTCKANELTWKGHDYLEKIRV